MDPEQRFTKVADLYARHRPGYPDAVVEWLAETCSLARGAKVLDVGCGTGISARVFAAHAFDVLGVDPNEDMLAKARAAGGGPHYERGSAEHTGQPDGAFDFAYAAQAFHWFDVDLTIRELRRVVRARGFAAAFWNLRADTPAMREYEVLLLQFSHEYATLRRPAATLQAIRERASDTRETAIANHQLFDWPAFHGRVHSSSYVAHGVSDGAAFDRELRALFDRHARADRIVFPYEVRIIAFR
jgi:ubiquinone/menaquinone biosynthesis C-methylase UbiE